MSDIARFAGQGQDAIERRAADELFKRGEAGKPDLVVESRQGLAQRLENGGLGRAECTKYMGGGLLEGAIFPTEQGDNLRK
ncbi:MAG: hypothetical protein ACYTEG_02675 [Planctomycetota bacterium]